MTVDRTPKPCLHKIADHQHGTYAAYTLDECRCLPCCNASSVYEQQRKRRNAYGRSNYVDADPARAHVAALMAAGVGLKRIVVRSGVSQGVLWKLVYGKRRADGTCIPSKRVTRTTADRLLALDPGDPALLADGARIDPTGTRRRLQALACLGWSIARIAAESDVDRQRLDHAMRGGQIVAGTARAVTAVYDRLWDQRPEPADRFEQGGITRVINQATVASWQPPAAWDDESIEDPTAEPLDSDVVEDLVDEHAIELVLDGQPMRLAGRDLEVAVQRLAEKGLDAAAIAGRVRSDETTVRRIRNTVQQRGARAAARDGNAA